MWQFISSIILIFLVFFLIYEDYTVTKKPYPRSLNGVVYNNTQYVCSEGILYNLFSYRIITDKFGAPRECTVVNMTDKTFNRVYGE